MFGLCCKRLRFLVPSRSIAVDSSVTHLHFIISFSSKSSLLGSEIEDDKPQDGKGRSFTVSYLINSFGFSPEFALSLSKKNKVHFESPEKPDSVIKLLKHYGLNDTDVSAIVSKRPMLLLYNAEKILLPKLEFLASIGISGTSLAHLTCFNTAILTRSLEKCLRPCYDIFKTLGFPDEKFPSFFSHYHHFSIRALSIAASNIPVLRAHGVPESSFPLRVDNVVDSSDWVPISFKALSSDSEEFKVNLKKVFSLGLHPHPSSLKFLKALDVISDASQLEQKLESFRKRGWTEDDVLLAFRNCPLIMRLRAKTVAAKMDFFLNEMGYRPADLAAYPQVLAFSLEKRIKPRFSVIRVLLLKGLMKKEDVCYNRLVCLWEDEFLHEFVLKYQEQVPELLSIFQGQVSLAELGLEFHKRGV